MYVTSVMNCDVSSPSSSLNNPWPRSVKASMQRFATQINLDLLSRYSFRGCEEVRIPKEECWRVDEKTLKPINQVFPVIPTFGRMPNPHRTRGLRSSYPPSPPAANATISSGGRYESILAYRLNQTVTHIYDSRPAELLQH